MKFVQATMLAESLQEGDVADSATFIPVRAAYAVVQQYIMMLRCV